MKIFASKICHQQFSWKFLSTFFHEVVFFKIVITIFFQNLFSHSRSRIFTRIEWWYSEAPNRSREEDTDDFRFPGLGRGRVKCGSAEITRISLADQDFSPGSNGGTPRLQIDLGKKIQTIFDSWLSGPGKLQHCPDWPRISQIFEISALVGNPFPTSTNTLFFPPNHSPPIVIWLPAWFCVRYVSHSWQKPSVIFLQWRLRHLWFVWCISENCSHHCHINISFHIYSLQLSPLPGDILITLPEHMYCLPINQTSCYCECDIHARSGALAPVFDTSCGTLINGKWKKWTIPKFQLFADALTVPPKNRVTRPSTQWQNCPKIRRRRRRRRTDIDI